MEEGCPQCSVSLDLSVKNTSREERVNVTSRDLVCRVRRACRFRNAHCGCTDCSPPRLVQNPEVVPVHYATVEEEELCRDADGGIVIVKLAPGEAIRMRCIATLGTSKEHAKWCSCCVATFRYDYEVTVNNGTLWLAFELPALRCARSLTCVCVAFRRDRGDRRSEGQGVRGSLPARCVRVRRGAQAGESSCPTPGRTRTTAVLSPLGWIPHQPKC